MAREVSELTDIAWNLIDEALTNGTMTLLNQPGKPTHLGPQDIVRIAQWLATSKAKKLQLVSAPDDFELKETTGGDKSGDTKS